MSAIKPPPYSPKDIAKAVTSIRRRKLLDPKNDPTIGSFFINPTISRDDYQRLSKQVPDLQAYPAEQLKYTDSSSDSSAYVKIPAGRLLDVLGWKGRCIGNVCMSSKWASIVTHNGQASGKEVFEYLMQVKKDVKDTYQIELAYEAVVI